nr:extracellular solute-binding protein [Endozoicomonas sp.]
MAAQKQQACLFFLLLLSLSLFARDKQNSWQHALSLFDSPKYSQDFQAFDYVNIDAPGGGHLRLAIHGNFDTLNPYNGKGVPPSKIAAVLKYGFSELNESLMAGSGSYAPPMDEQEVAYGLIAESVRIDKEKGFLEFKLNEKARFHDGHPITSRDVAFSFNLLASLSYGRFAGLNNQIENIITPSPGHIIFQLKKPYPIALPLHIAELPVLPEHYWKNNDFYKTTLTPPLLSGPYKINRIIAGQKIELERVKNYWGKDLPVNRGKYNFDRITLYFFRDLHMAFEAFKAGQVDAYYEVQAKNWATGYQFDAIKKGTVIRQEIPHQMSYGVRAFVFNMRKPYLQDRRVREAISLMLDWNWTAKAIFHNAYTRTKSYFPGTPKAIFNKPSDAEYPLLVPFSEHLPPNLLTQPFTVSETPGNGVIHQQQRAALHLLKQAGWELHRGKLLNRVTRQPMRLEFIHYADSQFERIIMPFILNLKTMGIDVTLSGMDVTQYYRRLQQHDFDLTQTIFPLRHHPGDELLDYFHSSSINDSHGRNLMGLNDPAVDYLIERIIASTEKEELETATSALDRVLLWQHYAIPNWHGNTHRLAWWRHLKNPGKFPPYGFSLNTWWMERRIEKQNDKNNHISR